MGTFHATCVRLLRRESDSLLGYSGDFVIFDTDDQRQVAKQALRDLDLDDKKFKPNRMLAGISAAKNELITPELYASADYISEIIRRVYQRYQEILVANNAMDFDDLLMNTVLLFDERPDVLQRYQQKYHHVLVDEFQDTNTVQYAMLGRLVEGHGNIFAVGDADQSIYKWRGADFRNINRFREQYPGAELILLEQNYRSTQVILDAAKAISRRNRDRVDKELFTERSGGVPITIREVYNDVEEADLVVSTIESLMLEGVEPGGCAVMYRTNAQSRVIEEAFIRSGINYRLVGATRFYGRREIKDLVAYLRLVYNPADSVSFSRIINTPTRGIGQKTQQRLAEWAVKNGWTRGEAVMRLVSAAEHPFTSRAYSALSTFGQRLRDWMVLQRQISVGDLLDTIVDGVNYRTYIDDGTDEGQDRWANIMELRAVARDLEDLDLGQFLEQVALVSDVDDLEEDPNAPTLLTLHAAKGLEFPVVFIVGLEDGLLPHSRSLDDGEELAEERRLFYVGLTRAKDQVLLSHAFRRMTYGGVEVSIPSRFLHDIPADLVEGGSSRQRRRETKRKASSWQWSASSTDTYRDRSERTDRAPRTGSKQQRTSSGKVLPEPNPWAEPSESKKAAAYGEQRYRSGQKVSHAKFGKGIVVQSKLTGNDEEVTVVFDEVGIKKLIASMAKLALRD
jgi:DNA helicase-2/ATP-dependent DNA helicase PcrA